MFVYIYIYVYRDIDGVDLRLLLPPTAFFFCSLTFAVVTQNKDKWAEVPKTVVILIVSWLSVDTVWH